MQNDLLDPITYPLHDAIRERNLEKAKQLVEEQGLGIDSQDEQGYTPLQVLVFLVFKERDPNSILAFIKFFFDQGADFNLPYIGQSEVNNGSELIFDRLYECTQLLGVFFLEEDTRKKLVELVRLICQSGCLEWQKTLVAQSVRKATPISELRELQVPFPIVYSPSFDKKHRKFKLELEGMHQKSVNAVKQLYSTYYKKFSQFQENDIACLLRLIKRFGDCLKEIKERILASFPSELEKQQELHTIRLSQELKDEVIDWLLFDVLGECDFPEEVVNRLKPFLRDWAYNPALPLLTAEEALLHYEKSIIQYSAF